MSEESSVMEKHDGGKDGAGRRETEDRWREREGIKKKDIMREEGGSE